MTTTAKKMSAMIEADMRGITTDGMDKAIAMIEKEFGRVLTDEEKTNGIGPEWPIVRFQDGSACDFSGDWAPEVVA
jgi:hypothetical protein